MGTGVNRTLKMYTSCISIWRTILCVCLAFGYVNMDEGNNGKKSLLDSNGGFTINIYISDSIDSVTDNFVGEIKRHFEYASEALYYATHKSFYFGAINIYVPFNSILTNTTTLHDGEDYPECEDYSFIVDAANPLYGDTPYTKHSGACGKQGEYVHLTDTYIRNSTSDTDLTLKWGEMRKVIVHEFAHWRWGVGEEYARPSSGDKQYYVNRTGDIVPNVCSKDITGMWKKPNSRPDDPNCKEDEKKSCIFIPYINGTARASLMSFPQIGTNELFCDKKSDTSFESNVHNAEAETQHNRMCNGKSVMEVIRSSQDWCQSSFMMEKIHRCNGQLSPETSSPSGNGKSKRDVDEEVDPCIKIESTLSLRDPVPLNHVPRYSWLNIFYSFRFNVSGKLIMWRYFARKAGVFYLSTWRDRGNESLELVGINRIEASGHGIGIHNVTEATEQINVEPGDMIGVFYPSGTNRNNTVLYYEHHDDGLTERNITQGTEDEVGDFMFKRMHDDDLKVGIKIGKEFSNGRRNVALQAAIYHCGGISINSITSTTTEDVLGNDNSVQPTPTMMTNPITTTTSPSIRIIHRKPEPGALILIIEGLKKHTSKPQLPAQIKALTDAILNTEINSIFVIHTSNGTVRTDVLYTRSLVSIDSLSNLTKYFISEEYSTNFCNLFEYGMVNRTKQYSTQNPITVLVTQGETDCQSQALPVDHCLLYDRKNMKKYTNPRGMKPQQQIKCNKVNYLSPIKHSLTIDTHSTCSIKREPNRILIFDASLQNSSFHNITFFKEKHITDGKIAFESPFPCDDVSVSLHQNGLDIDNASFTHNPIEAGCSWIINTDQLDEGEANVIISSGKPFETSIDYIGKQSNQESDLVLLETKLNVLSFNYSDESSKDLIVMATLTSGSYPVINASVIARIYMADLESNKKVFISEIPLWDNGIGVDAEANDGIYSNQVVSFQGNGSLSVDVTVDNKNKRARVKQHVKNGAIDFSALYQVEEPVIETTDAFQRYSPPLIIEVVNLPENGTDLYPPARVTDLFVIDIIQKRRIATIRFTVTGDDIMQGKASRVEVRSSKSTEELLQNFTAATLIANITSLELPGKVMVANLTFQGTEAEYYVVALKVIDDAGKESDVSNTASFYFENIAQIVTGNSKFTTTTAFTEVKSTQLSRALSVEDSLDIDTLLKIVIPIVVGLVILTAVGAVICYCVYKKRHTNKAPRPPAIADIINPYYNIPPPRTTEPDSMGDNPENCLPATEHGFIRDIPNNHHVISMDPVIHDYKDHPNMNIKPIRDSGLYTKTIQPNDPMPMIPHSALHENPTQYKPNDIPTLPPKQCPPAIPEKKHKKNNLDKIVLNARDKLKPVERKKIIHQATIPEDGDSDDIYDDTSAPEMRQKHENLSMNDKNRNSTTSTVFGDAISISMHDKRNIAGIQMGGTELPPPAACKRPKHDTKDPEPYHQTFAGKSALPKDDQPSPFARSSVYNDGDDGQINMFNFDRDLPTFNGKMKETYMFGARMQPGAFGHMRSPNATDDQKRGFRF